MKKYILLACTLTWLMSCDLEDLAPKVEVPGLNIDEKLLVDKLWQNKNPITSILGVDNLTGYKFGSDKKLYYVEEIGTVKERYKEIGTWKIEDGELKIDSESFPSADKGIRISDLTEDIFKFKVDGLPDFDLKHEQVKKESVENRLVAVDWKLVAKAKGDKIPEVVSDANPLRFAKDKNYMDIDEDKTTRLLGTWALEDEDKTLVVNKKPVGFLPSVTIRYKVNRITDVQMILEYTETALLTNAKTVIKETYTAIKR